MIIGIGLISLPLFSQTSNTADVLRRAEVMPIYQECQDERFEEYPYRCTVFQLTDHFMNSITVNNPVGLQTKGHLKFVVEIDGSVSNIDLVRGVVLDDPVLAQELDASIIQLANDLSFQSPGIDGGENVRVQVEFSVKVNY